tara:strand:+ start:524 stop:766 length:243 start_codon:yes stop_codon:yes gene_type:complete
MNIDIQIGDTILAGRFKNKKIVVKEFGVDDKGQPTINGRPILKFRIEKLMPSKNETMSTSHKEVISKHISKAVNKQKNKK